MLHKDFTDFYNKHVRRIYKFVYFRMGGNREKAEDATQEIFTKAFAAFERYDPDVSESAWIYTIARNHVINEAAKERTHESIENADWKMSSDWEDRASRSFDEDRLMNALRALPEEEAELVRMKYLEGWKYREMARMMKRSSGALRVQMGRILKKLRGILKQM
jgi:RNA polymerase sigma-70 factor (ECF subfamily)